MSIIVKFSPPNDKQAAYKIEVFKLQNNGCRESVHMETVNATEHHHAEERLRAVVEFYQADHIEREIGPRRCQECGFPMPDQQTDKYHKERDPEFRYCSDDCAFQAQGRQVSDH